MTNKRFEKRADEADALIRFFEDRGRQVISVTLDGKVIRLDFGVEEKDAANAVDFVRMDS